MRLFFGFDLAPGSKEAIADWRDRFAIADGRPVPPGNFHITLAFLGEIEERQIEGLFEQVDAWHVKAAPQALSITLNRVGYWPSPGIYWLGTNGDSTAMATMARKLGAIGQGFGARRDRHSYVPHVTLYRRCSLPPPAPVSEANMEVILDNITLLESRPGRSAVAYEPLAAWPLS